MGLGTGGIVVKIYAIFPDIPDVDELHSGGSPEAIYSAPVTFIRKFAPRWPSLQSRMYWLGRIHSSGPGR